MELYALVRPISCWQERGRLTAAAGRKIEKGSKFTSESRDYTKNSNPIKFDAAFSSDIKPYRKKRFFCTFGPQEDFQKGSEREYYFNTYMLDLTKYHMMFIFQPN